MTKRTQSITTAAQREIRQQELQEQDKIEAESIAKAQKNRGFTQVYLKGWERINHLLQKNHGAARLYGFFAAHIDPSCGAVVCDQQFLADQMSVTTRTIRRWLDYLEDERALVRIPVAGRICAYALDPHEVWKGYNSNKGYASFVTKTLVNKDGAIQRRIEAMFSPEPAEPPGWKDPDTPDMFDV